MEVKIDRVAFSLFGVDIMQLCQFLLPYFSPNYNHNFSYLKKYKLNK